MLFPIVQIRRASKPMPRALSIEVSRRAISPRGSIVLNPTVKKAPLLYVSASRKFGDRGGVLGLPSKPGSMRPQAA
jgi:hypothetical protein